MKVFAIRHPWAHLIIHGGKDIENRSYRTRYRGPLLILASKKPSDSKEAPRVPADVKFGGIVGIVRVIDCVEKSASKWFEGPFGFVLRDPKPLPFVAWPGQQSMFDAPEELIQRIGKRHLTEYLTA